MKFSKKFMGNVKFFLLLFVFAILEVGAVLSLDALYNNKMDRLAAFILFCAFCSGASYLVKHLLSHLSDIRF